MAQAKEYSRLLVVFSIIYFQVQISYKDLSKKLYRFLNFSVILLKPDIKVED